MSNKDREYTLDMELNVEGLQNVPEGKTPSEIFLDLCIGGMVLWGRAQGGLNKESQRLLYNVRTAMENAIKCKETKVVLPDNEMKFLNRAVVSANFQPDMNAVLMRVYAKMEEALNSNKEQKSE